jgi:amino acid transporter
MGHPTLTPDQEVSEPPPSGPGQGPPRVRKRSRLWRLIVGAPHNLDDPRIFHHLSLVAFLAWVGLGADGLSSSAYGPEEAYKALGTHTHLALILFAMTAFTIAMISIAYSNLIEHFPGGGGGYLVASKLLGRRVGVVSGCALLVDYVLTITVSVASACDQLWSLLPVAWTPWKLPVEFLALGLLILLNLRGVKESVTILAPIFILFIVTHAFAILYAIGSHATALPTVVHGAAADFRSSVSSLGLGAILLILLRAYSLGGGTYTGIEAVSNGIATLREPRVRTGRRTMTLMACSLAFTAGGILIAYLLTGSRPAPGQTMNAVMLTNLFGSWQLGGFSLGAALVIVSLMAEAALLFVAAQTGFLDGPRVLANMALDSWMPHRLAQLSDRLVTKNGVLIMGVAGAASLVYTQGHIATLVVMYSINVFITFSLTELGMSYHWIRMRKEEPRWKRLLALHGTGLVMCVTILTVTVFEKFMEGGWVTLVATSLFIGFCFWVQSHYGQVRRDLERLDEILVGTPPPKPSEAVSVDEDLDRNAPTAVICVTSFSGFGLHQVLSIHKCFPNHFKNFLFVSGAIADSGVFKGANEIERLKEDTEDHLKQYVVWARAHGLRAGYRMELGTEAVTTVERICQQIVREFPRAIIFVGKLIFREERWYHRVLHNETAVAIQRRLQFGGIQTMVLPIRVLDT